ncbi:MAG: hypothetical protein ACMXYM_05500 [Candidatus Woesearchaeota archaeon]
MVTEAQAPVFEELTTKQIEKVARMPIIETRVSLSKDRRYVIHRTEIVDIKPASYWEKVFSEE